MPDYRYGSYQPYQPYRVTPISNRSTQPVYGNFDPTAPGGGGGGGAGDFIMGLLKGVGNWAKDHAGDILQTGGQIAGGILDAETARKALEQQKEQFDKTFGLQQGNQAMQAQNARNRAPLADRGSYLAQNYTPPQPFQPRDWTQGISQIRGQATGGAQAQLAANNAAAANYKAGMGGWDTSVLDDVINKYLGTSQTKQQDGSTPQGAANASLDDLVANATYPDYFFPNGLPEKPTLDLALQEWNRIYPGKQPPPMVGTNTGEWAAFWRQYRDAYNRRRAGGA